MQPRFWITQDTGVCSDFLRQSKAPLQSVDSERVLQKREKIFQDRILWPIPDVLGIEVRCLCSANQGEGDEADCDKIQDKA
jgi:hypothetical protein